MRRLLAIGFSFVLLASHLGLSLSIHYCGGKVADRKIAIGKAEVGCGMERVQDSSQREEGVKSSPCCKDETVSFLVEDDFMATTGFTVDTEIIFLNLDEFPTSIAPLSSTPLTFTSGAPPPLLTRLSQSFLQVFRL